MKKQLIAGTVASVAMLAALLLLPSIFGVLSLGAAWIASYYI